MHGWVDGWRNHGKINWLVFIIDFLIVLIYKSLFSSRLRCVSVRVPLPDTNYAKVGRYIKLLNASLCFFFSSFLLIHVF